MTGRQQAVIIVAAGSGTRFGSPLPKQFCDLEGTPVVVHAIRRFQEHLPGAQIIIVVAPDRIDYWHDMARRYLPGIEPDVVTGGATRWESVANAIAAVGNEAQCIMVHDGARPLVDRNVLCRLTEAVDAGADGAIPVMPATESLRYAESASDSHAVDRSKYFFVQTPQAFPASLLRESYRLPYSPLMTDDASVVEMAGHHNIIMCQGSEQTLKITRRADLRIAALYLDDRH